MKKICIRQKIQMGMTAEQITTAAHEAYQNLPRCHVAREGFGQISFLEGFAEGVKWREAEIDSLRELIEQLRAEINNSVLGA